MAPPNGGDYTPEDATAPNRAAAPKVTGSAAAMKYYNSFPADQQEKIRTSTGGDLGQWFQNAVSAGSVQADGSRNAGEQTSDESGTGGGWTPDRIRKHFQAMPSATSGTGFNDTFDNIDDNTLWTWINKGLWDPNKKVFKNEADPNLEIDYNKQPDFKPTDCPAGMTPLGTNGKCTPNDQFDPTTGAYMGSGGGGAGAAPAGAGTESTDNPLQAALVRAYQGREGAFAKGGPAGAELGQGGIFWSDPTANNAASPQTGGAEPRPTGATTGVGSVNAQGGINPALASATLNAFTPAAPSLSQSPGGAQPGAAEVSSSPWSAPVAQPTAQPNSWAETPPVSPLAKKMTGKFMTPNNQAADWWRTA